MPFETTIETDPSCFESLNDEWRKLLGKTPQNHIFFTPEFLGNWWEHIGNGELAVVVAREAGELVGLGPFYRQGDAAKLIGDIDVSDYLDILVAGGREEVYVEIFEALRKTGVKRVVCTSVPEASATRKFSQKANLTEEKVQDLSVSVAIPKTWDEYLASLKRKQRHEIKRKRRRLEEQEGFAFELIWSPIRVEEGIEKFIHLHKASSPEKEAFWTDKYSSFVRSFSQAAANKGWLRLHLLTIGQKPVAAMLGFSYNNTHYLYNSGHDASLYPKLSPGSVLLAHTIEHSIEQGLATFDFLRGDEEYKFRFGGESQKVFDLTFAHPFSKEQ